MSFLAKCHTDQFLIILICFGFATCFGQLLGIHTNKVNSAGKGRDNYYYPIDTSFASELNQMRCVDHKGHVSGKLRWPYSCLLPAAHLATGRLYDGTSSVPERILTPPWLNLTLFEEGQRFARENSGHILVSHIYGLFITNLFLDSKEVLLFWGGFDTPGGAARRYTRIANGIFDWYRNTPPATDFPTFNEIARSIRNVRRAHRNVSVMAEARIQEQRETSLINPAVYKSRTVNERLWKAMKMDIIIAPFWLWGEQLSFSNTSNKNTRLNLYLIQILIYSISNTILVSILISLLVLRSFYFNKHTISPNLQTRRRIDDLEYLFHQATDE